MDQPLDRRFLIGGLAGAAGVSALAAMTSRAAAGPINPPAGPVAPTPGPEPRKAVNSDNTPGDGLSVYRITQPGSYYLAGNVQGVAGKHGISIAASGVTLDLNGFSVDGTVPGTLDGVTVYNPGLHSILVCNGTVRGWGSDGVDLGTVLVQGSIIKGIRAEGNVGWGIYGGAGGLIEGCTAYNNTSNGLVASSACTVVGCVASHNGGNGIVAGDGCTVLTCTSFSNTTSGIVTGTGGTVTGCTVTGNALHGVSAGSATTVSGCASRSNGLDGIRVTSQCLVLNNTCVANGAGGSGAGIHVTGDACRIEGNNCTNADRGIDVDAFPNIIVKNTCRGNATNWDVGAGNIILVVGAANAGPVNGNTGGTSPGSTDPNANFTY